MTTRPVRAALWNITLVVPVLLTASRVFPCARMARPGTSPLLQGNPRQYRAAVCEPAVWTERSLPEGHQCWNETSSSG
jgi:hypothetical protein